MAKGKGGFIGQDGLNAPDSPTSVSAVKGNTQATISFTAPTDVGGSAITGYVVTSNDGIGATGSGSPITVTGLTNLTAYTFRVFAINAFGYSAPSDSSNSVTPDPTGQDAYTTAGTYSWVCPAGISSVSVVAVGAGAGANSAFSGGGGGALAYANNISVTAGSSYSVVVGAPALYAGSSSFATNAVAGGGQATSGGTVTTGTGGSGGDSTGGGGGGAGGYSGDGGDSQSNGAGGGGGGGANPPFANNAGGGGGVGIFGEGASGAGRSGSNQERGGGGSGGQGGDNNGTGGNYGGGGGAIFSGSKGAVRIIYPGDTRSFPSTNTEDQ